MMTRAMGRIEPSGARVRRRLRQFVSVAVHRHDPEIDRRLQALLDSDRQWRLLARLSAYDRAHHLSVHDALVRAGHRDPDLLRAALLHDAGKADGHGRVRLPHRIVRVLGRAVSPARLRDACRANGDWLRHGLYLAEYHASLGASLARDAGAPEPVCQLIARHEEGNLENDPLLAALIAADEGRLV